MRDEVQLRNEGGAVHTTKFCDGQERQGPYILLVALATAGPLQGLKSSVCSAT